MVSRGSIDEGLLEALRQGDEAAWRDFFAEYDSLLQSVVSWSKWHFDFHVREDVAEGIRTELTKAIERYDGRSSFQYFVKRVCIHRCIDEVRRQVRRREVFVPLTTPDGEGIPDPVDLDPSEGFDPIRAVILAERADMLNQMLQDLDEACLTVITLFYLKQMAYKQIAGKLGIAINTVGSRLSKCLDKLRSQAEKNPELEEDM